MQGFCVCGLTMNTGGAAVGLARTEDKLFDRNTRHCWKTQIASPFALCSNSFYIGYRRFEKFIRSCIMDIRRAISAIHSLRELSHMKVPWAEVGQVRPQGFAEFFAPCYPASPSPITRRGPSEKCRASGMPAVTSLGQRRGTRSGLFAGQFCH